METVKYTTDCIFAQPSYMFQLPQFSYHQAAYRIVKKKFQPYKCSYVYKICICIPAGKQL